MYGSVIFVIMSRQLPNRDELIANSANVKFAPSSRGYGSKFCVAIIIVVLKNVAKITWNRNNLIFRFYVKSISRKITKCFSPAARGTCWRRWLMCCSHYWRFSFFDFLDQELKKYIKHLAHKNIKVSKWSKLPWKTFFCDSEFTWNQF